MKSKLILKKEVVMRLSTSNEVKGGLMTTDLCTKEPFNSQQTVCKHTFYNNCVQETKYNCDPLSGRCAIPAKTSECGTGDITHYCITDINCGTVVKTGNCVETQICIAG